MQKIIYSLLFSTLLCTAALANDPNQQQKNQDDDDSRLPGNFFLDVGFNQLQNVPEDMELKFFGSKGANIGHMSTLEISDYVGFRFGLGVSFENYMFKNDNLLLSTQKDTLIRRIDSTSEDLHYEKSKLNVNYVDVPIEFAFKTDEDPEEAFKFAVGGKFGVLFDAKTKIKVEDKNGNVKKVKEHQKFHVQRFRYGVTARIGYDNWNLFGYYALSELFEANEGPAVTPFTIGLNISGL